MASPDAYRFTVFANDHGDPFLSSTAELVVRIHEAATTSDVDEQELRILSPPIDFVLNLTEGTTAGQLVYRIDAQLGMMMTESVDGLVRYSLEPISAEDEGWLMIDENSGEVYLLRTLDYEVQPFITRSRSRSTTKQEASKEKPKSAANGSEEREAQGSIRKLKSTARTSSRSLRHVDDFPKLTDDAPLLFDPRRSERQSKKSTDGLESLVPPWGDRFKQFRRSLKGRSLSSSKRISPKPPSSPILKSKEEKPLKTNYSAYSEGDGLVFHGSPRISKRRSKSTGRTVAATPVTAILSSSNESNDTVIEKTHPSTLHGEIAVRAAAEGAKRQSRRDATVKPPRPEAESPYLSQVAVKTKEENTTQSPKTNQLTAAAKRRQFFRRSRSVATQSSIDSRRSNSGATSRADFTPLPPPLVTHFPVDDSAPITEPQNGQFDAYGGFIPSTNNWQTESRPATQSAGESGYISGLELSIPRSASVWSPQTSPGAVDLQSSTAEMSPGPRANSGIGSLFRRHARSPSFGPTSSASQRHRSTSGARGTIFERGPGSPRLGDKAVGAQGVMLRNRRLPTAKSESNLRRYGQSNNISWALDALRERVEETKYVTAVFESAKDGIAPILPDILKELKHWLGPSSRLLAVACEVHYSVPENVNAVVRSSLSQQRRSARLLRIEVQNADDNPPQFAEYSPLSQLVFTANESSGIVGQIRAIDLDPEPFDQIFYYLLPSCDGGNQRVFSINQIDGTIQWSKSEDDEVLESNRLCALASPRKLTETKVKELQFDRQNRSMIEFFVQFETNRMGDGRLSRFKNNTVISFDSNVRHAVISFNTHGNRSIETQKLGFELEAITFQPLLPHNQPADTLDLFAVPSNSPEVRVDSRIFKQPEGIYLLRIAAVDHSKEPKQKVGVLMSQVHYVRSDHKLRFVFEKPIDQIGLSLESFTRELEIILSDLRKQTTTIVLSSPRAYDSVAEGRNKSEVCFYIVGNGKIWTVDETINRISTNINPERRLLQLYQQYRVVNIENCATSSTKQNSAFTSELMSRELFVWTIALLVGILILLSLIGYTCFVTRYNNQEHLGIWEKPSPSSSHFVIGQPYVTTPHNSTIQRSRQSTQLRRSNH
ncbi:Cadherin domain-containing protein [Aphelenchoides besseyi]|nr:Cadherin domain-containing protein [Aphelenchoides besseyi]